MGRAVAVGSREVLVGVDALGGVSVAVGKGGRQARGQADAEGELVLAGLAALAAGVDGVADLRGARASRRARGGRGSTQCQVSDARAKGRDQARTRLMRLVAVGSAPASPRRAHTPSRQSPGTPQRLHACGAGFGPPAPRSPARAKSTAPTLMKSSRPERGVVFVFSFQSPLSSWYRSSSFSSQYVTSDPSTCTRAAQRRQTHKRARCSSRVCAHLATMALAGMRPAACMCHVSSGGHGAWWFDACCMCMLWRVWRLARARSAPVQRPETAAAADQSNCAAAERAALQFQSSHFLVMRTVQAGNHLCVCVGGGRFPRTRLLMRVATAAEQFKATYLELHDGAVESLHDVQHHHTRQSLSAERRGLIKHHSARVLAV